MSETSSRTAHPAVPHRLPVLTRTPLPLPTALLRAETTDLGELAGTGLVTCEYLDSLRWTALLTGLRTDLEALARLVDAVLAEHGSAVLFEALYPLVSHLYYSLRDELGLDLEELDLTDPPAKLATWPAGDPVVAYFAEAVTVFDGVEDLLVPETVADAQDAVLGMVVLAAELLDIHAAMRLAEHGSDAEQDALEGWAALLRLELGDNRLSPGPHDEADVHEQHLKLQMEAVMDLYDEEYLAVWEEYLKS